jgi:anti-sigma-K factor RskA
MTDDKHIEETLKHYRSDPGPQVRQSVMSRFARAIGDRTPEDDPVPFWKRPIPAYVAAAAIVVAVGLSFVAGQRTTPPEHRLDSANEYVTDSAPADSLGLTWEVALRDLL